MNAELEALVLALEAVISARGGSETIRLDALYQARLNDVLARHPNLSRATLLRMVDLAHRRWLAAQLKPTSLPPRA